MTNQYFVATALPAITLGEPPELSFFELVTLVKENLPPRELRSVRVIRGLIDLYNLAAFWLGEPLNPRGNLNRKELEEAVSIQEGLPGYVLAFLGEHETNEARLRAHGELVARFFQEEIPRASGFLCSYLQFEREWRLVMVGLRATRLKRDLAQELQWEDPMETLVAQLLAQRDARSFEPPDGYEGLKPIIDDHGDSPLELEIALEQYRFGKVSDLIEAEMFSINFILGYMVQLIIAEKWQELHEQPSS